jgi:hypothetical protein
MILRDQTPLTPRGLPFRRIIALGRDNGKGGSRTFRLVAHAAGRIHAGETPPPGHVNEAGVRSGRMAPEPHFLACDFLAADPQHRLAGSVSEAAPQSFHRAVTEESQSCRAEADLRRKDHQGAEVLVRGGSDDNRVPMKLTKRLPLCHDRPPDHGADTDIPTRRSLALHKIPLAPPPLPLIVRAPSFRLGPNRSRALAKASFTNSLLPITAPSVK